MKRQNYSNEFKVQVSKEAFEVGNKAGVARRYEIGPNLLHRWIRQYQEGHFDDVDPSAIPNRQVGEVAKENDRLKQLLGEKDLEIAILRDLVKKKNPHLLKRLK
ncbi:transposase [Paludifilum halophilum]|uniref:Transposase n=1 Tax=Paludifilum halophilum TaxID=1642702 RepID=A0A235B2E6_9BACL|nr:transposase [Paludifilum halophilum]OYD06129.1 transposase [Paludifilum halophilum]